MPATIKQSYVCEECGGTGRNGREAGITDRYATGDQQWRGYYPTNLCFACNGSGVWGVPDNAEAQKVEAKPATPVKENTFWSQPVVDDEWEDPRDRL